MNRWLTTAGFLLCLLSFWALPLVTFRIPLTGGRTNEGWAAAFNILSHPVFDAENILAVCTLIGVAAGAACVFIRPKRLRSAAAAILAVLAFGTATATTILTSIYTDEYLRLLMSMTDTPDQVEDIVFFGFGFWLVLAVLTAIAVANLRPLLRRRAAAPPPEDAGSQPE